MQLATMHLCRNGHVQEVREHVTEAERLRLLSQHTGSETGWITAYWTEWERVTPCN